MLAKLPLPVLPLIVCLRYSWSLWLVVLWRDIELPLRFHGQLQYRRDPISHRCYLHRGCASSSEVSPCCARDSSRRCSTGIRPCSDCTHYGLGTVPCWNHVGHARQPRGPQPISHTKRNGSSCRFRCSAAATLTSSSPKSRWLQLQLCTYSYSSARSFRILSA